MPVATVNSTPINGTNRIEEAASTVNVICVVPVRNESWVLPHFLECASSWADVIIVGHHRCTDQSAAIARRFEKVRLVSLDTTGDDRGLRRKLLLDEARKISGERLIFSIDADEMISANWLSNPEWAMMLNAPRGARFQFDWLEILPGLAQAAVFAKIVAFKDDGTDYIGAVKHEPPIPATRGEIVHLHDIKLLHYILMEPERMFSKHRWNKCLGIVQLGKRPWDMCIMYQDIKIKQYDAPSVPVDEKWLKGYEWLNEYRSGKDQQERCERCYWYDEEVLGYFDKYGTNRFRKLNIWHVDWNKKAQLLGRTGQYDDPRSSCEKWIHKFIESNRENLKCNHIFRWRLARLLGKTVLKKFGW
jgi:hypothetical protein